MPAIKKCILCGADYEVCAYCPQTIRQTPWRQMCDTSRHFQIYMIVLSLRDGTVTSPEAKEQLESLKVTVDEVKTFVPSVQKTLLPLFGVEVAAPKPKKFKETDNEPELGDDTKNKKGK